MSGCGTRGAMAPRPGYAVALSGRVGGPGVGAWMSSGSGAPRDRGLGWSWSLQAQPWLDCWLSSEPVASMAERDRGSGVQLSGRKVLRSL